MITGVLGVSTRLCVVIIQVFDNKLKYILAKSNVQNFMHFNYFAWV